MSKDLAQKIGRGGAGNFYTKKDLELALAQCQDVEDQKHSGSPHPPDTQAQPPGYLRSGRGGAGNIIPPSDQPPSSSARSKYDTSYNEHASVAKVGKTKVYENKFKSDTNSGPSGRGGAGNWIQARDEVERRREEEETKVRTAVHEQVKLDVELDLKPPPKAYTARETTSTLSE